MGFLTNIFKKKKKELLPANPKDDEKAAKVYDEEETNVPLFCHEVQNLPKGFTPNKHFSKHPKWNNQSSQFITRNRYNEPKAITAKQRRESITLKNV